MTEFREFFVGDKVRVVDEPYEDCPFSLGRWHDNNVWGNCYDHI